MSGGKKLMQAGGAMTVLGVVGMVTGAAMLAFSSAFGELSASSVSQDGTALMVAVAGASISIAGVAIVCIGLLVRPSRAAQEGRLYVPVHQRESFPRPTRRRIRRPRAHGPHTSEQPVVAGSAAAVLPAPGSQSLNGGLALKRGSVSRPGVRRTP